jgi:hypothetical protein
MLVDLTRSDTTPRRELGESWAWAAGLAAPDDPTAAAREAGWQLHHASPAVREVLRRLPPPSRAADVLGSLINDLHTKLATG